MKRWIVRNREFIPRAGNGVWHWATTKHGALRVKAEIETGTWRGGHYSLPVDLVVCRANRVFVLCPDCPTREPHEANRHDVGQP